MNELVMQYREIIRSIAAIDSKIVLVNHDISSLEHEYCPSDIKGIDYSEMGISSSKVSRSVVEVSNEIILKKRELEWLEVEKEKLVHQQSELEKIIHELGDIKSEVVMMKVRGMTNAKIADAMCYSQRQIERIIASMR